MSGKRKPNWENHKDRFAKKKQGKKKEDGSSGLCGSLTVQRLSGNVEGKCQKYSRIGPLTLVTLEKEATLENIKAACKEHFKTSLECDVLAGERGPSYTDASQIQNWKVIHVRFVETSSVTLVNDSQHREIESLHRRESVHESEPEETNDQHHKNSSTNDSIAPSVVASVSLSQMMRLGKAITPEVDLVTLQLEEFSVTEMWKEPFQVKVSLRRKAFSSGGVREAFMARAISGLPKGKYVVKKYRRDKCQEILENFGSLEEHTRKVVQMSSLARNFAQNLDAECPVKFGQTFKYVKVYFTSLDGEFMTIEDFIEGKFQKHINNDGEICVKDAGDIGLKAEAFVHYTYTKGEEQLMVTDIQGVGYTLCDPEIASTVLIDEEHKYYFCSGNLSDTAMNTFFASHNCNKFCELLKLQKNVP